jgi:hypothetical protein
VTGLGGRDLEGRDWARGYASGLLWPEWAGSKASGNVSVGCQCGGRQREGRQYRGRQRDRTGFGCQRFKEL